MMAAGPDIPAPALRVEGLRKSFGALAALDGLDLDVSTGEAVAVIGSSGSGKTTLLRCIAHLERPCGGTVTLGGQPFGHRIIRGRRVAMTDREMARARAGIGMVFQRFNLFPHLTALENITLGPLKVLGRTRQEAEHLAHDLLRKVGLPHKAHVRPDHLSGGQQQRVAIARSLAMQPGIMLFDEATSALDPELVGEVLAVVRDLAKVGMTMLIVTHEMSFAGEVADRIVVMDRGAIVDQGAPAQLLRAPGHRKTAALLHAQRAPHLAGLGAA